MANGYVKWISGRMEVWCNSAKTVSVTGKWGNTYISAKQTGYTYSAPFNVEPVVLMTMKGEGTDSGWIMAVDGGTEKVSPNYYIVRGDILNTQKEFNISVYAIGTWK